MFPKPPSAKLVEWTRQRTFRRLWNRSIVKPPRSLVAAVERAYGTAFFRAVLEDAGYRQPSHKRASEATEAALKEILDTMRQCRVPWVRTGPV